MAITTPAPAAQLAADVAALAERQRYANRRDPGRFECAHCGDRRGPLVPEPHGARYANSAQVLVCQNRCTPADADRHSIDFDDAAFAAAADRFAKPATESGDPAWDAWLQQRIAEHDAAWDAHHPKPTGGTR